MIYISFMDLMMEAVSELGFTVANAWVWFYKT